MNGIFFRNIAFLTASKRKNIKNPIWTLIQSIKTVKFHKDLENIQLKRAQRSANELAQHDFNLQGKISGAKITTSETQSAGI